MHKSAQFRDITPQWLERRKSCTQDNQTSASSLPAHQNVDPSARSRRLTASSSSTATVTPVTANASTGRSKQRTGNRQRRLPPVYVKLAEAHEPSAQSDSDSSAYNSLNEVETDFCRDESDYSDGYVTDGYANVDIFEYEVEESSSNDAFYSDDSSSGPDDMVDVVAQALFGSSSSDSDDFVIFAQDDADTEGSDAPTDPELARSDYWTCLNCKKENNSPMYGTCEVCFQERKGYWTSRPKQRRKRFCRRKRSSRKRSNESPKMLGLLSPSTSSSISVNDEKHDKDGRMSRNSSDGSEGSEIGNEYLQACKKRRRKTSLHKQNHSAGESSCCSSQELSPDEQQSTLPTAYLAKCASSQENYCSEIEHIDKQSNSNIFKHNYPNSEESVYPNSEPVSQSLCDNVFETARALTQTSSLASTVSACSSLGSSQSSSEYAAASQPIATVSRLVDSADSGIVADSASQPSISTKKTKKRKINFADEISDSEIDDDELMAKKFRTMDDTDSTNGMCMICLSEPKNGAFVHNRFLHVCCCYRCSVKVLNKRKRCPICNSQVRTVLKMFVH